MQHIPPIGDRSFERPKNFRRGKMRRRTTGDEIVEGIALTRRTKVCGDAPGFGTKGGKFRTGDMAVEEGD